ncbi:MAG: hypothetical protein O9345_16055 [Burkholderiaceae bacterium]|nr:hypothetical protein [Burkholderiales bacterium]MCZ8339639.1 hypothetical protein [Burkholderiaceae bacterium]
MSGIYTVNRAAAAVLRIFSGAVPANCAAADPSGLLVTMNLPSDWMAAAASGSKALLGTWSATASAGASTAPVTYRVYNSAGSTCHIQGPAGVGTGELQLNGSITSGQTVTVTAFTIADPNG